VSQLVRAGLSGLSVINRAQGHLQEQTTAQLQQLSQIKSLLQTELAEVEGAAGESTSDEIGEEERSTSRADSRQPGAARGRAGAGAAGASHPSRRSGSVYIRSVVLVAILRVPHSTRWCFGIS
jgi:hypothetical protein